VQQHLLKLRYYLLYYFRKLLRTSDPNFTSQRAGSHALYPQFTTTSSWVGNLINFAARLLFDSR